MRVLVCGGRDFFDKALLYKTLDEFDEIYDFEELVHGGARGADTLADDWAWDRSIDVREFPADWNTFGKKAGPLRNFQMLEYILTYGPSIVIAFPGGKGTAHMVEIARKEGVQVFEVTRRLLMQIDQTTGMALNIALQLYQGTEIEVNDFVYAVDRIKEYLNSQDLLKPTGLNDYQSIMSPAYAETQPTEANPGETQTNS